MRATSGGNPTILLLIIHTMREPRPPVRFVESCTRTSPVRRRKDWIFTTGGSAKHLARSSSSTTETYSGILMMKMMMTIMITIFKADFVIIFFIVLLN